jgi:hypothetical protein
MCDMRLNQEEREQEEEFALQHLILSTHYPAVLNLVFRALGLRFPSLRDYPEHFVRAFVAPSDAHLYLPNTKSEFCACDWICKRGMVRLSMERQTPNSGL